MNLEGEADTKTSKRRWMLVVGALFLPFLAQLSGLLPAVEFSREWIEVGVRPEAVDVDGIYEYSNPWPIPRIQGLSTPFPVDENHPQPAVLAIDEVVPETREEIAPIPVLWILGQPRFEISVPARGKVWVRVRYTQRAVDNQGTYILTTTGPWGKPLHSGEYRLKPNGVQINSSNYALTGIDRLSFTRSDFMPRLDWKFQWTQDASWN